jgi:excisionase family DNA binding protein
VKRRMQKSQNDIKKTAQIIPDEGKDQYICDDQIFLGQKVVEEFNDERGHFVSITLTREQSNILSSAEYISDLINGIRKDPFLQLKLKPDGRVVLSFSLSEPHLRMLRCTQVCQMLQISRSFLQKLIQQNEINSYKIGRLRRFILEDILNYLIHHNKSIPMIEGERIV